MAQNVRKDRGGARRKHKPLAIQLCRRAPLSQFRNRFRRNVADAGGDADFPVGMRSQIMAGDDFAFLDKDDLVAGDFHFAEQVGIQKYSGAAVALRANDVAHEAPAHGVETRRGLVEKNQLRLVNQGLRQTNALEHSFGKFAKPFFPVRSEADEIKKGGDAFAETGFGHTAKASVELEELRCAQPRVEAEILGEESNLPANIDVADGDAENERLAVARLHEPEEHLDAGTFPRSIRTEKAEDFAAADAQRKVAYGDLVSKYFAQVLGLNRKVFRWMQVRLPASIGSMTAKRSIESMTASGQLEV